MSQSAEHANIPVRPVFNTLPSYAQASRPHPLKASPSTSSPRTRTPLGPVPEVARVLAEFATAHRYPDPLSTALRHKLSARLGVDADDIVTGAGSLGALNQILKTFAGVNADGVQDEVIYAWRSFEAYPILVGIMGARSVQVPNLHDGSHDLDAMAAAITERTRLILVCTPNNPTGPAVTESQIRAFLEKVPAHIPVVIDEAYFEFCAASTVPESEEAPLNGMDIYRDYENVIILRTFSKAQGLAGLRVGYSISHPQITQHLRVAATPFAVTALAEAAAIASIEHEDAVMERVSHLVAERERVTARLRELGYDFPSTYANFVWLPLGERTGEFVQLMSEHALSVRAFGTEGVRVSIGEVEANDRFLSLCEVFAKGL